MRKVIERINLALFGIVVLATILRLFNLGYSDYQGDEIKALFLPENGQSVFSFLMDQRKGPLQFLVTFLIKFIDPNYSNQFITRFPFALAGILSVYFFYRLVSMHFGKRAAVFASLLLASNGFFVAFSRIVQYQSFVILFSILALYFFSLALKRPTYKYKGIILGFLLWALGILSHYDAVLILPFVFYLLAVWVSRYFKKDKVAVKTLGLSLLLSGLLLLIFYIPFILSLSESTLAYWSGRISGDVSNKISSSKYLFSVYQPIYVIHFYMLFSIIGLLFLYYKAYGLALPKKTKFRSAASYISLLAWFLLPFIFMEVFIYIPGTHIYSYLLPLFIIISIGLNGVYELLLEKIPGNVVIWGYQVVLFLIFTFIFAQSYAIYVDNTREYPWEEEKFLVWTFPQPTPIFHLSLFGFPYFRDWEGISAFTKQYPEIKAYSTNERKALVRYYVPLDKSTDEAGFYIQITHPQTFTERPSGEKSAYWMEKYDPIFTLTRNGTDLVRMYIMQPGTLKEIQSKGY